MSVKVCLGGTFNVIHEGHIALLSRAFAEGDEIYIGLTTDTMATAKRSVPVQDYDTRFKNLSEAVSKISGGKRFWIFPIDDGIGPAARENFEAIIVSPETVKGAERINKMRAAGGLRQLKIIVIDMVPNSDGEKLSSTRIIRGMG